MFYLEVCLHLKNQVHISSIHFVFINHGDESEDYFGKVRISDFLKRYIVAE